MHAHPAKPPETNWRSLDRAARSAAYDNRAAVPDSARRLAGWSALSAALRADRPAGLDQPYGAAPRQRFDLFASGVAVAPLLAFIHGGYWQRNSRHDFSCMALGPLAHGIDVAVIGYTLAPEAKLAAIVGEVRAALDNLRNGRRGRLVVAGWSAGGHLAALASAWPGVDGVLVVSGLFDLEPLRGTTIDDPLLLTQDDVADLSPIRQAGPRARQVVAYGADELPELRRQSRDYVEACHAAGDDARLLPLAGADHFSVLDALVSPTGDLTGSVVALASSDG